MSEAMELSVGTEITVIRTALPTILAADENDILGKLAAKVKAHKSDISTNKGRDEIRSLAAEVASSKVTLIKLGKSLTECWRKSTKAVNEECNIIEAKMDALKAQVRQPLTDFENAEKNRIAAHEAALSAIAETENYGQVETSHEIRQRLDYLTSYPVRHWQEFQERADQTLTAEVVRTERLLAAAVQREVEAAEFARLRAEEAERQRLADIEAQRIREERIATEAAETARKAAEAKAAREAEEAAASVQRAREAAERKAAAEVLEAEKQARQAREMAAAAQARVAQAEAAKIEAEAKAARDLAAAVAAEQRRAADAKAAEEAEIARRAANVAHRKKINGEALAGLIAIGLTKEQGKAVITAIAKLEIKHVTIRY